jgi:hypothetical protein
VADEMIRVDFLDYLTKGEIIFGDRIGFDTGTDTQPALPQETVDCSRESNAGRS